MSSISQHSIDYLHAIETLSKNEEDLRKAVSEPGPGGESYDRAPNSDRLQRKSAGFLKRNGVILAGVAAGALAVWAGREYWKRRQ